MISEWSLKMHGDLLEKSSFDFINASIPAYELIWKVFIGHKGNGSMADMVKISDDVEQKRKSFSQNHYTILESLYFMKRICDEETTAYKKINDIEVYRKAINQIMAFGAYLGRVVDCTERCFEIISNEAETASIKSKLQELYAQRHIILHGVKFPIEFYGGFLFIPDFSETKNAWHHSRMWAEIRNMETNHMSENLSEIFDLLSGLMNSILYKLLSEVNEFMKRYNLQLKKPSEEYRLSDFPSREISGSTFSIPPSGTFLI